jgi:hypothetical protein
MVISPLQFMLLSSSSMYDYIPEWKDAVPRTLRGAMETKDWSLEEVTKRREDMTIAKKVFWLSIFAFFLLFFATSPDYPSRSIGIWTGLDTLPSSPRRLREIIHVNVMM